MVLVLRRPDRSPLRPARSAAAPAALSFNPLPQPFRRGVVAVSAVLVLIALPTFGSERLTLDAAQGWRTDLDGAYGALSTAADLNPFAHAPLLVEAQIAKESDDVPRAMAALEEAEAREPEDWQSYFLGAQTLRTSDPAGALVQLDQAEALNPTSEDIADLREILESKVADEGPEGDGS